ncbi:hypothetical protein C8R46DRAFT_1309570 [Mycena filopes]|nr:hypothetical protein C8R46DRAFT_1309570 [Mycena filopes]
MISTAVVLACAVLLVHAIPQPGNHTVKRAVDLSDSPTVANKLTLYRCLKNDELNATRKVGVGNYPYGMGRSRGDFNVEGTHNLYFWDNEDDAGDCSVRQYKWMGFPSCESFCEKPYKDLDPDSTFAIATYNWNPPAGVKVQRYERDTQQWRDYVAWNWENAALSTTQRINDWIEGPLSYRALGKYTADGAWGMQHTLINPQMLPLLRIADIGGDLSAITWLHRRQNGLKDMIDVFATQMYQKYNEGEYDPGFGFAGICAGYSYASGLTS